MGLRFRRDPLCVVQLSAGDGDAHVVRLNRPGYDCPNLKRLLADPAVLKIFHFGRFDIAMFQLHLGVVTAPGLLHQDRLEAGPHLHRPPRAEGRGARAGRASTCPRPSRAPTGARPSCRPAQLAYAASDVLHLHAAQGAAGRDAGARGPHRPGPRLFRLPAHPRARSTSPAGTRSTSSPTPDEPTPPTSSDKAGRGPRRRDGRRPSARARAGSSCCAASCRWRSSCWRAARSPGSCCAPSCRTSSARPETSREIRLDKPMFHGQDAEGRSFVIGAQGAVRDPADRPFPPGRPGAAAEPGRPQGDRR